MKSKKFLASIVFVVSVIFVNTAPAPAREKTTVQLVTAPMGTAAYYFSFKFAELVNKTHPWLRLEVSEGMGTVPQMLKMMKKPELGKTTMWASVNTINQLARTGIQPFKIPYGKATGSKLLDAFDVGNMLLCWATADPEIKTIDDLAGKKIVMGQKGMINSYLMEKIFQKHGLLEKVKMEYMGFKPSADALADGLADAIVMLIFPTDKPNVYTPLPAFQELFSTKRIYLVSMGDKEVMNDLVKEGLPVGPATIPGGTIAGNDIRHPINGYYQGAVFSTDAKMDDEVVYEIVKAVYEHLDVVKEVHPSLKALSKDTLADIDSEDLFHPGAVKFFKEKGIPIGFQGL